MNETIRSFYKRNLIGLAIVVFLGFWADASACAKNFPRQILCLYDSSEVFEGRLENSLIHKALEMVLNNLGMRVKYFDVQQGIPKAQDMEDVQGILTWFQDDEMPRAREYCLWASRQIESGRRFVIFDNMGAFRDQVTEKSVPFNIINKVYHGLKLNYEGNWTENPFVIRMAQKDPQMVEFERSLENEAQFYEKIKSLDENNKIYLQLDRTDMEDAVSDAVVLNDKGGVVLSSFTLYIDPNSGAMRWRINPFLFLEEAFQLKGTPRYDTTTLFGRRIFYSHIDGDGFRNLSEISHVFSGEVIRDEILKVYPLPITASFIMTEVSSKYKGSPNLQRIAKSIMALPNVEIGSHTFTHPLDWVNKYVVFSVKGYSQAVGTDQKYQKVAEEFKQKGYRVTVDQTTYLKREIVESINYLNKYLAPEGKKVEVFQWSGDCRPPAEAIALVEKMGIKNINGGDTRFDRANPSYTNVAPLVRQVDGHIQFYSSNANENIYTHEWHGPFDWFAELIDTFEQTENPTLLKAAPRRISPINVYYHFYSGEKRASVNALKKAYDYALSANVLPLFTSEYVSVVQGFLNGKIEALADGGWRFSKYGPCQTVRFDDVSLLPDLTRSQGVIGFSRWHNALYVHLTEKGEAVLYLTQIPPQTPYLEEASNLLWDWGVSVEGGTFSTRGFSEGIYHLANMAKGATYEIEVRDLSQNLLNRQELKTDANGELAVNLPVNGQVTVSLQKKI